MTVFARSCVVGGTVIAAFLVAGVADAAVAGSAAKAAAATSTTWSTTLVDPTGTVLTGSPYTRSAVLSGSTTYFTARNTGTTALTGQKYTISVSGLSLTDVSLTACTTGPWQGTTCPGPTVAVTSGATAAVPIAVGGQIGLRLVAPTGLFVSVSVSVSTDRTHVRAATTTNS